jgi:hypothetical protein
MPSPDPIRAAFRRQVRIDCEVVREHDFRLIGDLVLDLSTNGMLVRACERVLTGEEVIVSFKPPRSTEWLDLHGVVARVLHGRRPGDDGLAFGVELVELSRSDELFLFDRLRGLSAPAALRPPRSLVTAAARVAA